MIQRGYVGQRNGRGFARTRVLLFAIAFTIASVVGFIFVRDQLRDADTFVEMHNEHMELYRTSQKLWDEHSDATAALRGAAARQPEDGAPITPGILALIEQHKNVLEKYSKGAESEFERWDRFDRTHFNGEKLDKLRALNSYHVREIRSALASARRSAQLAFDDIPTGPNSAVLVSAAAQDFSHITSCQVQARAMRERI